MSRIFRIIASAVLLLGAVVLPAQAQFADQSTYIASTGGSSNAQTITVPNVVSLSDLLGVQLKIKPSFTNNGAMTLNPNGLGAVAVNKTSSGGPIALTGSEFVSSPNAQTVSVMYDGSRFLILSDVNSSPTSIFPQPQGYLTPCSSSVSVTGCTVPNMLPTGDVTSVGTLYYRPGPNGNQIPIWNGSSMVTYQFSELALVLGGSNLSNTLYDVCVTTTSAGAYNVNGTPTVVTSVAWTTSTAGAGSRSTGAGTAQITQTNGIWTNAVQITGRNGANTYNNIPANTCTIVATIFIDGTAGQVTFHRTYGTNRKWSAWNFYNRYPITLKAGVTSNYTINSGTGGVFQGANGGTTASMTMLSGLPEETYNISRNVTVYVQSNPSVAIAIGLNGSVTPSGTMGAATGMGTGSSPATNYGNAIARFSTLPSLPGINVYNSLEQTQNTGQAFFEAGERYNVLYGSWRG